MQCSPWNTFMDKSGSKIRKQEKRKVKKLGWNWSSLKDTIYKHFFQKDHMLNGIVHKTPSILMVIKASLSCHFPKLTTFSTVILDHFRGRWVKFEICKIYNQVRLGKGQCWPLWLSVEQKFIANLQFSHGLTPFFRGSHKGLYHGKMGHCDEKISVLLRMFSMDDQWPTRYKIFVTRGLTEW